MFIYLISLVVPVITSLNGGGSIHAYSIESIEGKTIHFADFKGKYILVVNVASKCGYTPQYEALQDLQEKYKDRLVVIGAPCNQFGWQEPGNNTEIQQFCKTRYGVTFPLSTKIDVKGKNQHPIYAFLTQKDKNGVKDSHVSWNFQKYLLDKNGKLIDVFPSSVKPLDAKIVAHLK